MADKEYKNYDSASGYSIKGARLTKDPEVRDGANGKMVRLFTVDTSRNKGKNGIIDMWPEANVNDFQADLAAFLKKGDVLHEISGKPYIRLWGDDDSKFSFCIERAQLVIPLELFATLKERGFVPGAGGKQAKKSTKPKREVQPLPED